MSQRRNQGRSSEPRKRVVVYLTQAQIDRLDREAIDGESHRGTIAGEILARWCAGEEGLGAMRLALQRARELNDRMVREVEEAVRERDAARYQAGRAEAAHALADIINARLLAFAAAVSKAAQPLLPLFEKPGDRRMLRVPR